ncbi:hypothetical protein AZZ78_001467, partial [Klebsiella pneumoniae]
HGVMEQVSAENARAEYVRPGA